MTMMVTRHNVEMCSSYMHCFEVYMSRLFTKSLCMIGQNGVTRNLTLLFICALSQLEYTFDA